MGHWLLLLLTSWVVQGHIAQGTRCGGDILEVANATAVNYTKPISSGESITFVCRDGFKFPDMEREKTSNCREDGWDPKLLAGCDEHCDMLPHVSHSRRVNGTTRIGSTVHLECNKGYQLPDGRRVITSTCLPGGQWSNDKLPPCDIHCPVLPVLLHQRLSSIGTTYNTVVTFTCDFGHVLPDNTRARQIKCTENGTWSATLPPCTPVRCPLLVSSSDSWERNTTNVTYSAYVEYRCKKPGTRMLDGATRRVVRCDANAEWSENITDCANSRCLPLIFVVNSTCDERDAENGTTTTVNCIKGHRFIPGLIRSRTVTCLANLTWNPIIDACQPVYCPAVPTAGRNSLADTSSRMLETVVNYKCNVGHYYNDYYNNTSQRLAIECEEHGSKVEWSTTDVIPDCLPAKCPPPPLIFNGSQVTILAKYLYPEPVIFQCATGFLFIDGRSRRVIACDENGEWNSTEVSCRVDCCTPTPDVPHTETDKTVSVWYTNVTYNCSVGHEWPAPKTSHHIMCLYGGNWNDTAIPPCEPKQCEKVPAISHSALNTTTEVYIYNTYVRHSCSAGYKFDGGHSEMVHWCNAEGVWEPALFLPCYVSHCPTLPHIENATANTNETEYDTVANVTCLPGYQFPDKTKERTVQCLENEMWSDIPHNCEVVFCPPVPLWSETQFNSTDNDFLSVVSYSCKSGAHFKDHKEDSRLKRTTLCNITKEWLPPITDCVAEEKIGASLKGKTYESPSSIQIGTLSCLILGFILGGTILLDLSKIFSDLRMMRDNIRYMLQHRCNRKD